MRRALLPLALAAALGLGACGGSEEPDGSQTESPSTSPDRGRERFASSCGGCHTLAAADARGVVGPNLDELKPDRQAVLSAIAEGPGSMPAGLYEGTEAETVADWVEANSGQ